MKDNSVRLNFDLSDKTVKEYVQSLIDANLLFEVNKFSYSLKKQIRAEKKIYSIDTGMVNAIAFKFSENLGKLFENVFFLELKRKKLEIYYYKTSNDLEIDFVTKKHNEIELFQICIDLHDHAKARELKALVQGAQELGLSKGYLITKDVEDKLQIDGITIRLLPIYKYLLLN